MAYKLFAVFMRTMIIRPLSYSHVTTTISIKSRLLEGTHYDHLIINHLEGLLGLSET